MDLFFDLCIYCSFSVILFFFSLWSLDCLDLKTHKSSIYFPPYCHETQSRCRSERGRVCQGPCSRAISLGRLKLWEIVYLGERVLRLEPERQIWGHITAWCSLLLKTSPGGAYMQVWGGVNPPEMGFGRGPAQQDHGASPIKR